MRDDGPLVWMGKTWMWDDVRGVYELESGNIDGLSLCVATDGYRYLASLYSGTVCGHRKNEIMEIAGTSELALAALESEVRKLAPLFVGGK